MGQPMLKYNIIYIFTDNLYLIQLFMLVVAPLVKVYACYVTMEYFK